MQGSRVSLRLIRTYGSVRPFVIWLNQIEAHAFNVDEHFLQENYSEVQALVKTDCDPRVGINELRKVLAKLAAGMSGVQQRIEPEWARVRRRLEEMQKSFVSYRDYQDLCGRGSGVG